MSETHNPTELMGASQDIAPLAWVIDEIRGSLGEAIAGIKTFVAAKQDADSLRNARNQVHQANGALQLLDLRGVALMTEAVEALLRRWESEPKECLPTAVRTVPASGVRPTPTTANGRSVTSGAYTRVNADADPVNPTAASEAASPG